MAHMPDKPEDPISDPLMIPKVDSPLMTPPPLQSQHPKRFATKCNHELHPSASSHTPYCPPCVLHTAQAKLEVTQETVMNAGGLDRSWELRNREWVSARLAYYLACSALEKARTRDQLRWEREQAWDEAHLQSLFDHLDITTRPYEGYGCSLCSSGVSDRFQVFNQRVDNTVVWWDRPGVLISPPERKISTRSRFCRKKRTATGSSSMRSIIHNLRTALLTATSEQQIWETRYKTESAVRRKHGLGTDSQFDPKFWDSPVSGVTIQDNYRHALEERRMAERRARGNTPRPRPPRSSLSYCESAEAIVVDKKLEEAIRLREEADEIEREARKVGEEVGYLYFVGALDGLEEWRDDVLKSKPHLVWRDYDQSVEGEGQDEIL
jgi:hypothetical protein